jgi:hypothetical protein
MWIYDGPWPGYGRFYMSFGASIAYVIVVHGFGPWWVARVEKNEGTSYVAAQERASACSP